ncbi:MAG TPA: allophanate hydrolase [Burkholderiales bacterium]|jgi:allophanate hydrolase|nr:allophanate hydrolase [Burkholderiales bacterium]
MTISSLLAAYRSGKRTPGAVVESLQSGDDEAYACTWICRVGPDALKRRTSQLEQVLRDDPRAIDRLPLYGIPFAVKDNIDVAGLPTTAACPAFSYVPERSATVVEKLEAAGAILVGKTNLDQFATGLVGTRSPYGAVPNAFRPEYISGGSSSGSAVSVARGQVSFSLGTDTAGSGRVPAAFNNIVGLKPSRGLISARGVVPACQSLDCVSVFALTVPDAVAVLGGARGPDAEDPWSRALKLAAPPLPERFTFALPEPLEFHGDNHARHAFHDAVDKLEGLGGKPIGVDFSVFLETAALLYEGPWVAERLAAIRPFFEGRPDQVHPVVRKIIEGASKYSAADLFSGLTKLEALKKRAATLWDRADVLVVPTAPTIYTIKEVLAEPFLNNRRLGHYTNFVNLMDLAACAVPGSMRPDGLPCGITLIAPAGADLMLADLAQRFHHLTGLKLGALDEVPPPPAPITAGDDSVRVAVVGAHLSGLPLNHQLTERGARLEKPARTSARYRLFALPGTMPPKPGMVRDTDNGSVIDVEVWRVPVAEYGSFVAGIPSPLGIGRVELDDGEWIQGFLCESWAVNGAEEISHLGGWRAYLASKAAR